MPNLLEQAQEEFPILREQNLAYKENFGGGTGMLEFWPADEPGTPERPRPTEIPPGRIGVEVYDPKTRPIDVAGDVVTHHLVETDPTLRTFYEQFQASLTPDQQALLARQYEYYRNHPQFKERRPFEQWVQRSGLPGLFRGYAFQQWEGHEEIYTPQQIQLFDQMMSYLRGEDRAMSRSFQKERPHEPQRNRPRTK